MRKTKKVEDSKIEIAAKEWIRLKTEKLGLESRIEETRKILEPYLESQPEGAAELVGFRFKLVTSEREFFKLAAAKEKIDGRILKPYITLSTSNQIRTTFHGKPEEVA